MQYEYWVRRQRVQIEQLDNVMAVSPASRSVLPADVSRLFGDPVRLPEKLPARSAWRPFATAGWLFVNPGSAIQQALANGGLPGGAQSMQRVFLRADGRFLLGLDRLNVRLTAGLSYREAEAIAKTNGLAIVRQLKFAPNLYQVQVTPPGKHFLDAAAGLYGNPDFEYAEPDFIEHLPGRMVPTDPQFGDQWHLCNTGQQDAYEGLGAGAPGADVGAETAWDTTLGDGIKVAIVDNGFDLTHPDLPPPAAVSGYFDYNATRTGAGFTQGTANYPAGDHGTLCAGMAIARVDNGVAGCGVAPRADFIAIACAGDELDTQATLARAIAQAADPSHEIPGANPADGADVISCSLGSAPGDPWQMMSVLKDAIDWAVTSGRGGKGTPVFWATNDYPVAISGDQVCAYPNTIAVGMSNRLDQKGNSAFGPELDFLAPGVWVHSTSLYGGFRPVSGTSFAAPLAAGVGALVLSACPGLSWQQVRQIMRQTCQKIGAGYNGSGHADDYGYGRISAAAAVQAARAMHPSRDLAPPTDVSASVT